MTLLRFSGRIAGFGTASGRRVVIGHWPVSPFGAFTDCMVEDANGHRTLLAPTSEVADFVARTYHFDEVRVVPVAATVSVAGWSVSAGPLTVTLALGRRTALGWLLRLVPAPLATSTAWATLLDPIARRLLRGSLTPVVPAVPFGPGSTPALPSVVNLVSTVECGRAPVR